MLSMRQTDTVVEAREVMDDKVVDSDIPAVESCVALAIRIQADLDHDRTVCSYSTLSTCSRKRKGKNVPW